MKTRLSVCVMYKNPYKTIMEFFTEDFNQIEIEKDQHPQIP